MINTVLRQFHSKLDFGSEAAWAVRNIEMKVQIAVIEVGMAGNLYLYSMSDLQRIIEKVPIAVLAHGNLLRQTRESAALDPLSFVAVV